MKEVLNKLIENGYEALIIGGYVRDFLLNKKSDDIDICTNASIEEIKKIFGNTGIAFEKYYSYHIKKDNYKIDITTYRIELEYQNSKPVKLLKANTLLEDLIRRDFTVNTIAMDNNGNIIDLLNAKKDLDSKIIKVVGNTFERLTEDKTRILRAIRFSCELDFELDEEIKKFIKNNGYLLKELPKEYIRKEIDLIFNSNNYLKFFELVKQYNLEKYLSIEFQKIDRNLNKYEIWSQIKTTLPFSKKEIKIINNIRGEKKINE